MTGPTRPDQLLAEISDRITDYCTLNKLTVTEIYDLIGWLAVQLDDDRGALEVPVTVTVDLRADQIVGLRKFAEGGDMCEADLAAFYSFAHEALRNPIT